MLVGGDLATWLDCSIILRFLQSSTLGKVSEGGDRQFLSSARNAKGSLGRQGTKICGEEGGLDVSLDL